MVMLSYCQFNITPIQEIEDFRGLWYFLSNAKLLWLFMTMLGLIFKVQVVSFTKLFIVNDEIYD